MGNFVVYPLLITLNCMKALIKTINLVDSREYE